MPVRRIIPYNEGLFFITFTCWKWLSLFEVTDGYDIVYKWFDYLKSEGHYTCGYVIMPNHLHGLFAFRNRPGRRPINTVVGNGKRFIAYELIKRLHLLGNEEILIELEEAVRKKDRRRNKLHEVFEPSFDWKECESEKFIEQKLNYIHNNPCSGNWNLADNPWEYKHSSAQFYYEGTQGAYEVLHYQDLQDIDLTRPYIKPLH